MGMQPTQFYSNYIFLEPRVCCLDRHDEESLASALSVRRGLANLKVDLILCLDLVLISSV